MFEHENGLDDMNIFEDYTPLERPPQLSKVASDHTFTVNSDDDESDSYSSSSSSSVKFPKRVKKRTINSSISQGDTESHKKSKKYEGWVACFDEDIASDFMNIGFDRNRQVESYNYRLKRVIQSNGTDIIKNPLKDLIKNEEPTTYQSKKSRFLPTLQFYRKDSIKMLTKKISSSLQEKNIEVIESIIRLLGKKVAVDLYNETKNVEKNGGMLTLKEDRRRTSGGIFILLAKAKCDMNNEEHKLIFQSTNMSERKKPRHRRHKTKKTNKMSHDTFPKQEDLANNFKVTQNHDTVTCNAEQSQPTTYALDNNVKCSSTSDVSVMPQEVYHNVKSPTEDITVDFKESNSDVGNTCMTSEQFN